MIDPAVPSPVEVTIHPSQFPDQIRAELVRSLEFREMNHQFHYNTVKQAQRWLAIHRAYSPFRVDPEAATIYRSLARATVGRCKDDGQIHLVGLGCGDGEKDLEIARALLSRNSAIAYTPCDVSTALALIAHQAATRLLRREDCHPLVCDLARASDLGEMLERFGNSSRIVTFFGMLPNFSPGQATSVFKTAVRTKDLLLLSANLAPGSDYERGVAKVLPQYDNQLTKDWLILSLLDLGVEKDDGAVCFVIEDCPEGSGLRRIAGYYQFARDCLLELDNHTFAFRQGDKIRLFFSYRHTADRVAHWLAAQGFSLLGQWIAQSEEEGVFLCQRI